MRHTPTLAGLLATLVLLAPPSPAAGAREGVLPLSAFPTEPVVVETRSARRHEFRAWRAETDAEKMQGLMFVPDIEPDQGMIFVYDPPQPVAMWMKNTLLPLDMLFVDAAGCVVRIERDARPGSLETIRSGAPVMLVVELKGGTAKALGIANGDRVRRPAFGWPPPGLPCTTGR